MGDRRVVRGWVGAGSMARRRAPTTWPSILASSPPSRWLMRPHRRHRRDRPSVEAAPLDAGAWDALRTSRRAPVVEPGRPSRTGDRSAHARPPRRRRRPRSSPRTSTRAAVPARSYASVSAHVARGSRKRAGTSGHSSGTSKPKVGSVLVGTDPSRPSRAARTIDRVWAMFIRSPLPYGPPVQPVLTSQTWASCAASRSVSIRAYSPGMARHERRPEARRERGLRLLDADLGAGQLGRVAADEVVGGLGVGQAGDRRQHAEGIGREQDDGRRLAGHPGRVGVADEMERVRAAGVLGEALGVEVELAGRRVDVDVLEHRAEPARRLEDVRLVHRREADRLRVAAALEVEQPGVAPAVLVVADEPALRVRRERGLAGPRQAEEDRAVALRADVDR